MPTRIFSTAFFAALLGWLGASAARADGRPWDEAVLSPSARAEMALKAMTQEEKLAIVHGGLGAPWGKEPKPAGAIGSAGFVPGVPRLGIPALQETDAELGIANPGRIRPGDGATAMPSDLALASSFDPPLARRQGEAVGAEARARGFSVLLGGAANLVRDPFGGRNFEYFSEDPLLTGVMAGEAIAGAASNHIITTTKHFALNDQETERVVLDARIDPEAARESDLLAFEMAIERGKPCAVMCAHNKVNGVYSCENSWLLSEVLKGDWRYSGYVLSDWGAVHSTIPAALAGLDQESGQQLDTENFFAAPLADAVAKGEVPQARLDDMTRRILTAIFASGLYDDPPKPGPIDPAASDRTALDIEREGVVLLKNDDRVLPLAGSAKRLAVIGAHADLGVLSGGGSSQVAPRGGAAASELSRRVKNAALIFDPSSPVQALRRRLPGATIEYDGGNDPARAAKLAAGADAAIVFVDQWMLESVDAPNLALPDGQDALIEAVARANPRTIVVIESGGPVLMPWLEHTPAVLEAWYPGQQGGEAIADILTGAANPSGHLPATFPTSEAQLPRAKPAGDPKGAPLGPIGRGGHYGASFVARYDEGADVGYKWFARNRRAPLFPFGFGLSYTTFALHGLEVAVSGQTVTASVAVRNTGARTGAAVPQFYVLGRSDLPIRLVGWERVALQPGEEKRVRITVDPRLLARFDEKARRWRLGGAYQLAAGWDAASQNESATVQLAPAELPP